LVHHPPQHIADLQEVHGTPPALIEKALADGRGLLLFDGLDEIADPRARVRVVRSLVELSVQSPGNTIVIGSRPGGVGNTESMLRPRFQRCDISQFTQEDVRRFFQSWYALDSTLTPVQQMAEAAALYRRVDDIPRGMDLARTPLLSTILLRIWSRGGDLPERRVDLYERCCRILIDEWEAHHDVAYQSDFANLGWEEHLRILAPLAYRIHVRELQTAAHKSEIVPILAQVLEEEVIATPEAAEREAEGFLGTLGTRSGLLQYLGNDLYGFPHLTFQEYLAARYIAKQRGPLYIDLVMMHLHEAWWREVHLLTIGVLGSGTTGAVKASKLLSTILHLYPPPSRMVLQFRLSTVQRHRQLAWLLDREFELAMRGYDECRAETVTPQFKQDLLSHLVSGIPHGNYFPDASFARIHRASVAAQSRHNDYRTQGMRTLVDSLRDTDHRVRRAAAEILGRIGQKDERVVTALLQMRLDTNDGVRAAAARALAEIGQKDERVVPALLEMRRDTADEVRRAAARALGRIGQGDERVVPALLEMRLDTNDEVRRAIVRQLHGILAGRAIPGYRWTPMTKER
jgi:hypothetical protein